jgi:MoxR-like ATPase
VLLEGVPGLAKTLTVASLAESHGRELPADPVHAGPAAGGRGGDEHLQPADGRVHAPARADLRPGRPGRRDQPGAAQGAVGAAGGHAGEAGHHQRRDVPLEEPFLVLATQNPIEQEGTYPLPEAQVDRFMLKLKVTYPDRETEKEIMRRMAGKAPVALERVATPAEIMAARAEIAGLYMDDKIIDYIVDLVHASREPAEHGMGALAPLIEYGASPRASIFLATAARAHAFIDGRGYVLPEDVKTIGPDVLRHRIITTYEAEAEEVTSDDLVRAHLRGGGGALSDADGSSTARRRVRAAGGWLAGRRPSRRRAARTLRARRAGGVPREVLRQVRLIELRTRGWVNTLFSGEYHSVFKGQGMEFAEVREYQHGDDIRAIDWNVTARMGHPYIKKHVEERELTVMLLVDLSGSEQFGTRGRLKAELAAELAAVLALSAIRNNDRVGLLIFTDHVEHVVPPKKGRRHVLRLIRDLLAFRPTGRGTDIATALDYAGRMLPTAPSSSCSATSRCPRAGTTDGDDEGIASDGPPSTPSPAPSSSSPTATTWSPSA